MWKYVSCCVRETVQRGVNYFDVRCGAGLASNQNTSVVPRKDFAVKNFQEKYRCSDSSNDKNTKKEYSNWCNDHFARPWLNAFSWSGAIVLGWYANQLMCLSRKRRHWFDKEPKGRTYSIFHCNTKALQSALLSCAFAQPSEKTAPVLVGNSTFLGEKSIPLSSASGLDEALGELGDVLSSVETRLGLAALEGGDTDQGLTLLQSAARRNHAPALYNLAICYEKGVGVKPNDKMAVELYGAAASLQHPAALYNLAVCHGQGRGGLAPSPALAWRLLRLAAARGQPDAVRLLRRVAPPPPAPPPLHQTVLTC